MTAFKVGQRVRVEFVGVIPPLGGGCQASVKGVSHPYGDRLYVSDLTEVRITLADPQNWPPQVGDIWEAGGEEYYAEEWGQPDHDPAPLVLQPFSHRKDTWAYGDTGGYAKKLDDFKALSPVLVRRRGQ